MKTLIALLVLVSAQAQADGFRCFAVHAPLTIKIYNHIIPQDGTRVGSVMILSDDSVQYGNKTIAKFSDASGLLATNGALYTAKVDLRFANSSRKGELIAGTKLGELSKIEVGVNFSYNAPMMNGDEVPGHAWLTKRNGQVIELALDCVRYLKN